MSQTYYWSDDNDFDAPPPHIETQGAMRYPGAVFACEQPEAPIRNGVIFHDGCRACLIAVEASDAQGEELWCRYPGGNGRLADMMRERIEQWGLAPRLTPSGSTA